MPPPGPKPVPLRSAGSGRRGVATTATMIATAPMPSAVAGTPAVRSATRSSGRSRDRVSARSSTRIATARNTKPETSTSPGTTMAGMSDTETTPMAASSGIRAVSTT